MMRLLFLFISLDYQVLMPVRILKGLEVNNSKIIAVDFTFIDKA